MEVWWYGGIGVQDQYTFQTTTTKTTAAATATRKKGEIILKSEIGTRYRRVQNETRDARIIGQQSPCTNNRFNLEGLWLNQLEKNRPMATTRNIKKVTKPTMKGPIKVIDKNTRIQ